MKLLERLNDPQGMYVFFCPGCDSNHAYYTKVRPGGQTPVWTFNGNMDRPSFQPSLLNTWNSPEGKKKVCHLYVTDGKINYCGDCTHDLSGKSVEMKEVDF